MSTPLSPLAQEVMDDLLRFCASTEDSTGLLQHSDVQTSVAESANAPVKSEPEDASPLSPAQSPPDNANEPAAPKIQPGPTYGDRFQTRDAFKLACQQHACSFSAARPSSDAFHFATRTSAAGKWLVFSCHQHAIGCPCAVRVEYDNQTSEWVVTSANYTHACHGSKSSEGGPMRTPRLHRSRSIADARRSTLRCIDTSTGGHQPALGQVQHHSAGLRGASDGPAVPNFVSRNGVAHSSYQPSSPYARLCQQRARPKMEYPYPASFAHLRPALYAPEAISASASEMSGSSAASQVTPFLPYGPTETPATLSQIMACSADKHAEQPSFSGRPRSPPIIPMPGSPLGSYLISLHPLLFALEPALQQRGIKDPKTLQTISSWELEELLDSLSPSAAPMLQRNMLWDRLHPPTAPMTAAQ